MFFNYIYSPKCWIYCWTVGVKKRLKPPKQHLMTRAETWVLPPSLLPWSFGPVDDTRIIITLQTCKLSVLFSAKGQSKITREKLLLSPRCDRVDMTIFLCNFWSYIHNNWPDTDKYTRETFYPLVLYRTKLKESCPLNNEKDNTYNLRNRERIWQKVLQRQVVVYNGAYEAKITISLFFLMILNQNMGWNYSLTIFILQWIYVLVLLLRWPSKKSFYFVWYGISPIYFTPISQKIRPPFENSPAFSEFLMT